MPRGFDEPYSSEELALDDGSDRLAQRLAVSTPTLQRLHDVIRTDLVPNPGGVGWWGTPIDMRESILIGDLMADSVRATRDALVEARVSQELVTRSVEATNGRWRQHLESGGDPTKFPPPRAPADELVSMQFDVALLGFFTSLGQALDCLSGAIIGIYDLAADMRKSGWRKLGTLPSSAKDAIRKHESVCGPRGWLDWLIETRNGLVHRPRQLNLYQNTILGGDRLLVPSMRPIDRLKFDFFLWRSPELSWVEALADSESPGDSYLRDSGELLIDRIFASTLRFMELIASDLTDHWTSRRNLGQQQQNFASQWTRRHRLPSSFDGFDVTAVGFDVDYVMLHPTAVARMAATHIMPDETRRATWQ